MQAILTLIFDYFWGAWRYRWLMLALVWLISVAGWIWVSTIPEQYKATARIYVDTNSILRPLLRGLTIQPDLRQRTALVSRTLLSRPNLEKLTRMTDLDLQILTNQDKEALYTKLRGSIRLSGERNNPSLYTASFMHEDRNIAKLMVQSLITVFTESTLGNKRLDSDDAQTFIEKQIADYEVRLKEAELRLVQFRQKHAGTLGSDVGAYYQRLQDAKNSANAARLQLSEMENRRAELERQLEDEEDDDSEYMFSETEEIQSYSPYSAFDQRIQSLQQNLDNLSLKYTGRHPEVIQIRSMISELEAKKRRELSERKSDGSTSSPELLNNPVYQQKQTMLAEAAALIAELQIRVEEYEKRARELEEKVDEIPQVEAELKQLNRDYGAISAHHAKLLSSRESAYLSEDMEEGASTVKFRVIDPPFVPLNPTEPNKLLLNTGVFFVAIAASIGIAILLSLLNPVIINRRILSKVSGLPVFGCVTYILSPDQQRKELIGTLVYASLALILVLAFVGVNVSQGVLST